jgi:hypothetical protein
MIWQKQLSVLKTGASNGTGLLPFDQSSSEDVRAQRLLRANVSPVLGQLAKHVLFL